MPTLIRLFVVIAVIAGLVYGAMVALTIFVTPEQRTVSVRVAPQTLFSGSENG